jgi:Cytochrome c
MRVLVIAAVMLAGCGNDAYDLDGGDQLIVGKAFVDQRGCPTCHQSANPADGILSGQSTPQPNTMAYGANLTPDVDTGLGGWADIEIVRAMRFGVDNDQAPLCPTMPHFDGSDPNHPGAMTDLEANAIVAYLRSLPAVSRPDIPESTCPPIKPPPEPDLAMAAVQDLAVPPPPTDGGAND